MKEVKGKLGDTYHIVKTADNLTKAMAYALNKGIVGSSLVVKEIEEWEIRER